MKAPTCECVGICGECGRYRPVLSTIPDSDLLAELQRPERARLVCKAMEHVIDAGLDEQVPTQDQRGLHLSDAELVAELKRREAERVTGLIAEAKARAAAMSKQEAIEQVMSSFDFERVAAFMALAGWKWGPENKRETVSAEMLKETARKLLERVPKGGWSATGGLQAYFAKDREEGCKMQLEFVAVHAKSDYFSG